MSCSMPNVPDCSVVAARMRLLGEIDDAQRMAGVGITTVNPVPEDRNVGEPGFLHDQELVHGTLEAAEHRLRFESLCIEKQDRGAHFIDADQPRIAHFLALPLVSLGSVSTKHAVDCSKQRRSSAPNWARPA